MTGRRSNQLNDDPGSLFTRGRSWQGRVFVGHAIAIALAVALTGVSYLFVVAAIAFAIASHFGSALVRSLIAAPVAAVLFFPLGLMLCAVLASLALAGR